MKSLIVCALALGSAACASEIPYLHRFSAGVGRRDLGKDFEPLERQTAFALDYGVRGKGTPLGLEFGFSQSSDDGEVLGVNVDVSTIEAYAGLRYDWSGPYGATPYLSGGVTYIDGELEALGVSISDSGTAGYAGAGIDFPLVDNWFLGIGLRYIISSDLGFAGLEADVDGLLALFKIGYRFWSYGPRSRRY